MVENRKHPCLPKLLRTSVNGAADYLEEKLDIRFIEKPNQVNLGFYNRLVLYLNEITHSIDGSLNELPGELPKLRLIDVVRGIGDRVGGFYVPDWATSFVVPRDKSIFTGQEEFDIYLHEHTHGYVFQRNTKVAELRKKITDYLFKGQGLLDPIEVEEFVIHNFYNEGIAAWVVGEINNRSCYVRPRFVDEKRREAIQNGINDSANRYRKEYDESLPKIKVYLEGGIKDILTRQDRNRTVLNRDRTQDLFNYGFGPLFIDGLMTNLIGHDLSLRESLNLAIDNFPISLNQIEDVEEYALLLLHIREKQ